MIEQDDTVVRVLLAAGDRELERRLSQELAAEGIVIAARCLDGPSLLERAAEPGIDVVLASANLHHLSEPVLLALRERRRPVVLLAGEGADIVVPETINWHSLRHTAASLWLRAGIDVFTVSRRLGHGSASFTMDTYGHLLRGQQRAAAEALDHLIG